jgi:hypothetical protein
MIFTEAHSIRRNFPANCVSTNIYNMAAADGTSVLASGTLLQLQLAGFSHAVSTAPNHCY